MIQFPVTQKKQAELISRMDNLGILEEDLVEHFVKSSGNGGQKVNKTSTTVVLKYGGTEVKCSKSRSQGLNRYYARVILCEKLEMVSGSGKKFQQIEKIRKQKEKRKSRAKKKHV